MTPREHVYGLSSQIRNLFGDIALTIKTVDYLYYLNKAQTLFINEHIKIFEQKQYITDILRTLVKDSGTIIPTGSSNKRIVNLPNDYKILEKHSCTISAAGCNNNKTVPGILVQIDDIEQLKKDPFWKPISIEPLYYIMGNTIVYEIPNGDFDITGTQITYIKKESAITLSDVNGSIDTPSELPEHTHESIIDIARELIIGDKQLNVNN